MNLFISKIAPALAIISLISLPIVLPRTASAATASNFNPGRIIDDSIFFNKDSMGVQDIQNTLNDLVDGTLDGVGGTCDTYGDKAYFGTYGGKTYNGNILRKNVDPNFKPPYRCVRDYIEDPSNQYNNLNTPGNPTGANPPGGIGAAQIIYNAAQTYGINPRILIVLIQKESVGPILTDDWPWYPQYKTVTGYGCPDTAPCASEFFGFYNQVTKAARQFRLYANTPSSYNYVAGKSNNIPYHPNASCGTKPVFIENQATAGLYNYTPYTPNTAAMANLYGTGDSCSSYGNRNFWRMYTDWFGSSLFTANLPPSSNSYYAKSACSIQNFSSSSVGRLYQPNVGDFLYTSSRQEACAAIKLGYIWDGLVFKNSSLSDRIPVYRISSGTKHIFTPDPALRSSYLGSSGYTDEGIAFYANSTAATGRLAVNSIDFGVTTLLTNASGEATLYQQGSGYTNKGISFYSEPAISAESLPVYRLSRSGGYLYTLFGGEKDSAVAGYGYRNDGIAFAESSAQADGLTPVYRLRGPNGYFYTTDRAERDNAVVTLGYINESIAFYAPLSTTSGARGVFRMTTSMGTHLYTAYEGEVSSAGAYGFQAEGVKFYAF